VTQARLFKTRNDLPQETRDAMVALLNQQLADTFDLYSQAKQAHWNVKGKDFFQLHELFDEIANAVLPHVDTIAERATALGGIATGTVRMASEATRLPEYPLDATDGLKHIECVADRLSNLATTTRAAIDQSADAGDLDTSDLFTDLSRDLDKYLWFVEAHIQA
jgi:starvation-inducible DNA-binding protein